MANNKNNLPKATNAFNATNNATNVTNATNTVGKKYTSTGTDVQHVRQQNAESAGVGAAMGTTGVGSVAGNVGTEFGSETDAQHVRQQNQQSEQRKVQATTQGNQNTSR